jgi:hypothetical protein
MTINRRSSVRFPAQLPAMIKCPLPNGGTQIEELRTLNISAQGVLLDNPIHLPLMTNVEVDIIAQSVLCGTHNHEAENDFISITGRIVRKDCSGLAIAFDLEYRLSPVRERILALRHQLDWIIRHHGGITYGHISVVT